MSSDKMRRLVVPGLCDVCRKPLSAHSMGAGIPVCPGIAVPTYRSTLNDALVAIPTTDAGECQCQRASRQGVAMTCLVCTGPLAAAPSPPTDAEVSEAEVQYEVYHGDEWCAAADTEADGRHYLAVYAQDADARLVRAVTHRTEIAAMRKGEG
jgi:3-keto-L-gulonate-6-phosphate decarboxylase